MLDFNFTEEQAMLRNMVRDFLGKECPKTLVREMIGDEKGYSSELWHKMAELGLIGLALPVKYGGGDGDFMDLVILSEEAGRACLLSPFLTHVLCEMSILEAGGEQQKEELLPKMASGETIVSLALLEPNAWYDAASIAAKAVADDGEYVLNGTKLFVPYAHIADYLLCAARTKDSAEPEGGISLFLVDRESPGISTNLLKTMAGDKRCEVLFENVGVPKGNLLGKLEQGWTVVEKLLQIGSVALCGEMIGGAQAVLEMAVDHVKEKIQFGEPLGRSPIIQTACADMFVDLEASRIITYEAAWKLSRGLPCEKEVSMAKAWVNDAYRRIVVMGHHVVGGVAFITDHDMYLYFNRAKPSAAAFGNANFHRALVAKELGL